MAVRQVTDAKDFIGLSTDTKPIDCYVGSTFYETDTRAGYIFNGTWVLL